MIQKSKIKITADDYGYTCTYTDRGMCIIRIYQGHGENAFDHAYMKFVQYLRGVL
jgi:hypothetical protein